MSWEERKRERKPPAPSSDYKPSVYEAAPYYTEDLNFLDSQDINSVPADFSSRRPENPQYTEAHREDAQILQELKEKCAFLESQLHNSKLKLSHYEKDNEKMQEELSEASSNRKTFILEQELISNKSQLDIKNKQTEALEKALKGERAKYSQELQELKAQMKNFRENFSSDKRAASANEENKYELLEIKEKNRVLENKIAALEREREKLIEKYENDLQEQYYYFKELLEEKNFKVDNYEMLEHSPEVVESSPEAIGKGPKVFEKNEKIVEKSEKTVEKSEKTVERSEKTVESTEKFVENTEKFDDYTEKFVEYSEKSEENLEDLEYSENIKDSLEQSNEKLNQSEDDIKESSEPLQDFQLFNSIPNTLFSDPSPSQVASLFTPENNGKLSNLFDQSDNSLIFSSNTNAFDVLEGKKVDSSKSSIKSKEIEDSPYDYFNQPKTEFVDSSWPNNQNSEFLAPEDNPGDFFTNLKPASEFQTIPSNLFDY